MSFLLALILGFVLGAGGTVGYEAATQPVLCTEFLDATKSDLLASGLTYLGAQQYPGAEVHGFLDQVTGDVTVYAFDQSPESIQLALQAGFVSGGTCVSALGTEIYIVRKTIEAEKNEAGASGGAPAQTSAH